MASKSTMILLVFVCFFMYLDSSMGREYKVGGPKGWVVLPPQFDYTRWWKDYSQWADQHRFVVDDVLDFEYKKGEDSVMQVKMLDYYMCNTTNPIWKSEDGSSKFKLTQPGQFYFISGVKDHCENGERLTIHVLRHNEDHPFAPQPSISPESSPLAQSPSSQTSSPKHHHHHHNKHHHAAQPSISPEPSPFEQSPQYPDAPTPQTESLQDGSPSDSPSPTSPSPTDSPSPTSPSPSYYRA